MLTAKCVKLSTAPGVVAPDGASEFEGRASLGASIKTRGVRGGADAAWFFADLPHGRPRFAKRSALSDAEIATVTKWVDPGSCPQGISGHAGRLA